jgi:tetratricopeptide (TPR) repeat protein
MYLSSDGNSVKNDKPNLPVSSNQSQFGSMNPNLYTILIIIGLIQILLIGYWLIPRAAGLYYQTRGGQIVDRVLSRGQMTQWNSIACASPRATDASTRTSLEKAEKDLKQAIRFSPDDSHPQLLMGRTYCMLGEPEKAIESYRKYVELRPSNPLGKVELGFAYEAACQIELAASQGTSNLRPEQQRCNSPKYLELMISTWKAAGLTTQDFIDSGESARRNGRNNDALAWFRRASEFNPDSGAPYFYIGQVYEALNGPRVSTASYQKSFDLGYVESIDALMEVYTGNGDVEAQVELLEEALDRYPGNPERQQWWNRLGEMYTEQEDWNSAIQVYENAIVEFPDNPGFHINLGLAYYEGGENVGMATDEIKQAIALDPDSGIGYYSLARLLAREKRYAEADNWFERAIGKNPNSNWWPLVRANTARAAGNLALAQQEYLAIIERSPNFTPAYYEIAQLYRLIEEPDQSISAIEQAIDLSSNPNQEYFFRAAGIYEWTGNLEKALDSYRQILALDPENEVAMEKVQSLSGGDY